MGDSIEGQGSEVNELFVLLSVQDPAPSRQCPDPGRADRCLAEGDHGGEGVVQGAAQELGQRQRREVQVVGVERGFPACSVQRPQDTGLPPEDIRG